MIRRLHEVLSVNAPITHINCLGSNFQLHAHLLHKEHFPNYLCNHFGPHSTAAQTTAAQTRGVLWCSLSSRLRSQKVQRYKGGWAGIPFRQVVQVTASRKDLPHPEKYWQLPLLLLAGANAVLGQNT